MNEKIGEVIDLLKAKSVFEESKNGDKGHVIWSNNFHKLSEQLIELFDKPDEISCRTCTKCELYENENTRPSNTYFCKETEETINDIDQHYCDDHNKE